MKNVAMLLGAGASVPFFPNTQDVTDALLKWDAYREPINDDDSIFRWMNLDPKVSEGLYFQKIYEITKEIFRKPESFLHFERLIHIAHQLESFTRSPGAADDYTPPIRAFLDFKANLRKYDVSCRHGLIAADACKFILTLFSEKHDISYEENLKKSYLNAFLRDLNKDENIKLFSLNYDTLPLYSGIDFETGFRFNADFDYETFSSLDFFKENNKNLYCQMHGSVLFGFPSTKTLNDQPPGNVARYRNAQCAERTRKTISTGSRFNQDGFSSSTYLMITGLRKADDILNEPYASYFHRMFSELVSSNVWIIVGYGGADSHINACLKRARDFHKQKNERLKIIWVGYAPDEDFDTHRPSSFENRMPLHTRCGQSIENSLPMDCVKKMMRREEGNFFWIKQKEIQSLSGGYCDVRLSFEGTEETFKKFSPQLIEFINS